MNISKIVVGEKFSLISYFEAVSLDKSSNTLTVKDQEGNVIDIIGKDLIENRLNSDAQFFKTVEASKSEMAKLLESSNGKIFTVNFIKQSGEERILRGYYISNEPYLGRTKVCDLEVDTNDKTKGIRLIDNRTIKFIVINDIKYIAQ